VLRSWFVYLLIICLLAPVRPVFAGLPEHAENQSVSDPIDTAGVVEAPRYRHHGLLDVLDSLRPRTSAQWLRLAFGIGKAAFKTYLFGGAADWSHPSSAAAITGASTGTEVGATVFETQMARAFQNFPVPLKRVSPRLQEGVALVQGSLNSSLVWYSAVPALFQALNAINHPGAAKWPTLATAGVSLGMGLFGSAMYTLGDRGSRAYVRAGFFSENTRSIAFALLGFTGFYAGIILTRHPGEYLEFLKVMGPLWFGFAATWASSFHFARPREAGEPRENSPKSVCKFSRL
jgi:hypothetical protein